MVLVCFAVATAASARGQRIALVIGNGNYQQPDLPKLANPTNDAEDMARALRGFGFEVIERKNQTLEGMNQAIAEFGSKIGGSEAALFYYAGHGIQVKNQNYLIPVNARIESEASVLYQGVNLNQVLDEMDNGKSGANIVMLDACRNNPITGKFRSGQSRGLAYQERLGVAMKEGFSASPVAVDNACACRSRASTTFSICMNREPLTSMLAMPPAC